jgi:hypothetical protein
VAIRGEFHPDGKASNQPLKFEVDTYRSNNGKIHKANRLTEYNLAYVESIVVKVTSDKGDCVYTTIFGPFNGT